MDDKILVPIHYSEVCYFKVRYSSTMKSLSNPNPNLSELKFFGIVIFGIANCYPKSYSIEWHST